MDPCVTLGVGRRSVVTLVILQTFCLFTCCSAADQFAIGALFAASPNSSVFGFRNAIFNINGPNNKSFQFVGHERVFRPSNSFQMGQKICSMFTAGILMIGADIEPPLVNTASSYSSTFYMPIILSSLSKRDMGYQTVAKTPDFLVSAMPSLVPVLYDLIRFHKWNVFAYVYDSDKGLLRLQTLIERLPVRKYDVAFRKMDDRASILDALREFRDSRRHRIICDLSVERTRLLMEQIPLLGMVTSSYHYIFLDLDIEKANLQKFQLGGMNITGFKIVDEKSRSFQILKMKWERSQKSLAKSLGYVGVSFDGATGPVSFDSFGERVNYTIRILSLFSDGMREVGTWQSGERGGLRFKNGTYGDGSGAAVYKNRTFIVTTVLEKPYLMYKEPRHLYSGNGRYQGYAIDILEEIVKKYPFRYKIRLVRDKSYGIPVNGTWNGMVGEIISGMADIAVAPLTITADRERVIDFTKPFMSLGISIMIKKPQTTKPDVFSFMHPLSYEIWMCIVLAYVGVSVVLFLVSRFSPREWYPVDYTRVPTDEPNGATPPKEETTNDFGMTNSLWFSFGALMQQGSDISPRSFSGRIVGGVWWFFTLIIISSYTANLAAFLTVERMVTDIQSVDDLVASKDVSYGIIGAGSTEDFFRQSKIPMYMDMWSYMNSSERSVLVTSNEQGVERLRHMNGKFAFLMESTLNEYFSQQKPCDTMKVGQNLDSKSYGIGVSRNLTKLSDDLTLAILQLREEGVLDALKKRWWFDKGQCHEANADSGSNALSLSNVAGVFYILVGGLAMALLAAIVEFYWKSRSQSRKQKTSLTAAMRAKVRLSVTGDTTDLANQLHPKTTASAAKKDTETTPTDKQKNSAKDGSHTEV